MRCKQLVIAMTAAALAAPVAAQAPAKAKSAAKPAVYCLEFEMTGSRVRKTECLTKTEWANRGVDVDELLKK